MATHQIQVGLQRASRRRRDGGGIARWAATLGACFALLGAAAVWAAIRWFPTNIERIVAAGLSAGFLSALLAAVAGRRIGLAIERLAAMIRQVEAGAQPLDPPAGCGPEIAHLAEAAQRVAASFADERRRTRDTAGSLREQLRQRTAEAEQRSKELESFLYSASHDLRAPVLSIQGFANLLSRNAGRRLDEQSRDHLTRIRANAEAMEVLLRDLLEVSRVGRVQEEVEWVDSGELLEGVLRDLEPEANRIGLGTEVAGRLPMVAYPPRLLSRVFRNLLDNALKFMGDQPSPRVRIGAERLPDGYRFWVEDNGMGIAPEDRERIFDLFSRAHTARAPGSGVGLAIVRRIVETHGGRVWVDGSPGRGSSFSFTVPAAGADSGSTEQAAGPPGPPRHMGRRV